ncbi:hypothetical protein ABIB73_003755 [Bradyrhizobium sp. F1.4.3]|uniref:hypothetical protein n=1 Tax=Bradyrhizobium sp. F1.4.3 TaxID=3156356 RepID=UPI003391D3C6
MEADRDTTHPSPAGWRRLAVYGLFQVAACCISLGLVIHNYNHYLRTTEADAGRLLAATATVLPFALVFLAFAFSRFSFGYAAGVYMYTLILGYLWLVSFSAFPYDHGAASISAFLSGVAFLAPALLITSPIKQHFVLTPRSFRRLLSTILVAAAAVVAVGSLYNFRFVQLQDIYRFRNELEFPVPLEYAIGIISTALLPFAFACFIWLRMYLRAASCLFLLALFWPITLSKVSLFAPIWLLFLTALIRFFEPRAAVIFSLLLPLSAGVVLATLDALQLLPHPMFVAYFGSVNFRMFTLPSIALDYYNDYFSTHDLTHFCQIGIIKRLMACPLQESLPVLMQNTYKMGFFNASLFATEGIASVGMKFAPLSALCCGLLVGLVNRLSQELPANFILLSGGLLLNLLLNVPLSVALATHGASLLIVLWYIAPRSMFVTCGSDVGDGSGTSQHP